MTNLFVRAALLPEGWERDVRLTIEGDGTIAAVTTGAKRLPQDEVVPGYVLPGMPNAHSHAFQRAFAGRAEPQGVAAATFWSWRTTMYRYANALDPDAFEAIATLAFIEMLAAGYTSVAEFYYLHHDRDGSRFANPAEMSERLISAARRAGIRVTLLPVLYAHAGTGTILPLPEQRRFVWDVDGILVLCETLVARHAHATVRFGVAPHSLRAVTPDELRALVAAVSARDPSAPLHIHVAEQRAEVEQVMGATGFTPIRALAEFVGLDRRWSLVHATHAEEEELRAAAVSGAAVVIAPTTEANLGDGIFALGTYLWAGGAIAVGSDSNVSISAAQELRWLTYLQRLRREERMADPGTAGGGEALYRAALAGGASSLGQHIGALAPGFRADFIVLDPNDALLEGIEDERVVDAFVFAAGDRLVRDVMVNGRWVIRDRIHPGREAAEAAYRAALRRLA